MLIDAEGDSYSRMEETVSENGVITITFEDYDEEPAYYEDDED
jgi:hypothetical protein